MPVNRYFISADAPQPIRKILAAPTDIKHTLKVGERLDHLATKWYQDPTLSWVIMSANPQYTNEFEIPFGAKIRIPFPLQRVFDAWRISKEI